MSYCRLLLTPRMTLLIVIGSLIYSVGLNQFIVPVGLYNGGFLGIAQLIRHFMESWFGISFGNTNIAGILYFILNIPLLAVSVKRFGKEFLAKTIYCVCWYSLFLTVVPIADHLLVDEHLTACVAGGVICGIGAGMTLLSGGSGGGEEILGLLLMQKHSNLSVGKVSAILNIFIFGTCAVIFSISQAIYSVLFTGIVYYVLDKVHFQNIMLTLHSGTKKQKIWLAVSLRTSLSSLATKLVRSWLLLVRNCNNIHNDSIKAQDFGSALFLYIYINFIINVRIF